MEEEYYDNEGYPYEEENDQNFDEGVYNEEAEENIYSPQQEQQ